MTRRDVIAAAIGAGVAVLVAVGIFLGVSYIPPSSCTTHALFVGQTVIEGCW